VYRLPLPKSAGERHRRGTQEKQGDDCPSRPLKDLGINHCAEMLKFADDPRRTPFELLHFYRTREIGILQPDYAA
jgi:hypothetical protein